MNDNATMTNVTAPRGNLPLFATKHGDLGAREDHDSTSPAIFALNLALALANHTVLRCRWQYGSALRHHSPRLAGAALSHANEARTHARRIADRIVELNGKPLDASQDSRLDTASLRNRPPRKGKSLNTIVWDDLMAARSSIQRYRRIAAFFAPFDLETSALIESVVAGEEACASELADVVDTTCTS